MKPRQILRGTTYLITRRTTQRLLLLRPSKVINECIRYCLAIAQRRSGVKIHCVVFLSNHYHLVVTDLHGNLPVFTEELNKLLARSLNCHHGRWENFWSSGEQTSHVTLASDDAVLEKLVYSLANPTEAGLVGYGNKWPGVRLHCQGEFHTKKPDFFFRTKEEGGKLPDQPKLVLTPPPIGVQAQLCDDVVKAAVSAREKQLREQAFEKKRKFMGQAAILKQDVNSSPRGHAPKRGMSPRVASRDKWRRIEVLARLAAFASDYREKREAFAAGATDIVFPAGTYQLARQFGLRCAEV